MLELLDLLLQDGALQLLGRRRLGIRKQLGNVSRDVSLRLGGRCRRQALRVYRLQELGSGLPGRVCVQRLQLRRHGGPGLQRLQQVMNLAERWRLGAVRHRLFVVLQQSLRRLSREGTQDAVRRRRRYAWAVDWLREAQGKCGLELRRGGGWRRRQGRQQGWRRLRRFGRKRRGAVARSGWLLGESVVEGCKHGRQRKRGQP